MEPQTARLDRAGRLVLPASVRAQLELREGDEVVFTSADNPDEVRLIPRRAAVRLAQRLVRDALPDEGSLVEALLSERRGEAARDAREERARPKGSTPPRPRRSRA